MCVYKQNRLDLRPLFLMLEVSKVVFVAAYRVMLLMWECQKWTLSYTVYCTIWTKDQRVCQRCWKRLKIHYKNCNAIYVEGVKRSSKYTIRAHNIFAYNFLNIKLIFNLKTSFVKLRLRAFQPYQIKCYVCWGMLEVLKVKITHALA